jgi:hypothetical protein
MPAKGKTNASRVEAGERVIVKIESDGRIFPSATKTGEGVQVVRVTGKGVVQGGRTVTGRGTSRNQYLVHTTAGTFQAAPVQTMWLAPEDSAGIKRAHAEALAEDETRRVDAKHAQMVEPDHEEALAEDTRRMAIRIKRAHIEALAEDAEREAFAQGHAWAARHDLPSGRREHIDRAILADHEEALAEDLTLHSQGCKVDNVNNDANCNICGSNDHSNLTHDLSVQPVTPSDHTDTKTENVTAAQPENHTGSTVVSLLEKVWARIRADHPELPEVVIITGSGLLGGSKWGHFRADGWKVQDEGAALRKHELFLAGEALAKGARQTLQTMLHEAAHTLAKVRGEQDTSRQGRWHNATFRKMAEELGLAHKGTTADKTHGFSFVTLTAETTERYADLLTELDAKIKLTCHLPLWLGGTADQDGEEDKGGEKITGKPTKGEGGTKSGPLKATCGCAEPLIIRLSQKVLDMGVVRCDECMDLFTAA